MKVYIGWDSREARAFEVAERSFRKHDTVAVEILDSDRLRSQGLLYRPTDHRGQRYDIISNAPMATDFAISRFLVPFLAHSGWAMFTDCDVVLLDSRFGLLQYMDPKYAVLCVKHKHVGGHLMKMDGQQQTYYARKNWSSVMLWNCDHPANRRLTLHDVNTRPGRDLHAFYWLHDSEIGELPAEWNWLVGVQPKPASPKIAHFTLGGPWLPGWAGAEHDEIWLEAEAHILKAGDDSGLRKEG